MHAVQVQIAASIAFVFVQIHGSVAQVANVVPAVPAFVRRTCSAAFPYVVQVAPGAVVRSFSAGLPVVPALGVDARNCVAFLLAAIAGVVQTPFVAVQALLVFPTSAAFFVLYFVAGRGADVQSSVHLPAPFAGLHCFAVRVSVAFVVGSPCYLLPDRYGHWLWAFSGYYPLMHFGVLP